jgi:hypothetical protein
MTATATKTDPYRFFVYREGECHIWGACPTYDRAVTLAAEALARNPGPEYLISEDWDAFFEAASARFMTGPVKIDQARWDEMLGIMPPMRWKMRPDGVEVFMICEAIYGDVYTQFGRVGDLYAEKPVRLNLTETHLTRAEIEAVNA